MCPQATTDRVRDAEAAVLGTFLFFRLVQARGAGHACIICRQAVTTGRRDLYARGGYGHAVFIGAVFIGAVFTGAVSTGAVSIGAVL